MRLPLAPSAHEMAVDNAEVLCFNKSDDFNRKEEIS